MYYSSDKINWGRAEDDNWLPNDADRKKKKRGNSEFNQADKHSFEAAIMLTKDSTLTPSDK